MNKRKKITYYCDMDGVLANFDLEPKALDRFKQEKGFFANLQPITENVAAIEQLLAKGYDIKILSTSPNEQADHDKKVWLKKYLPAIAEKDIIMARPQIPKIDYIPYSKRIKAVLFDDYGKNIQEWLEGGGVTAIKITKKKGLNHFENIEQFVKTYLK